MTAAFVPARRLGLVGGLRNSFTLTWRSLLKIPTNMEDLFSLSLTPIMYRLLFTYVFGGAISGSTHKYLQFSLPGIGVLTVVFATMGTGMMLNADITTGVFDRFRALPIARWAPLAGAILGDAIPASWNAPRDTSVILRAGGPVAAQGRAGGATAYLLLRPDGMAHPVGAVLFGGVPRVWMAFLATAKARRWHGAS